MITVTATRTQLPNGKPKKVKVIFKSKIPPENLRVDHELLIYIDDGGVTSYEGFMIPLDPELQIKLIARLSENGWRACHGTSYSWDRLHVPAESMVKVFDEMLRREAKWPPGPSSPGDKSGLAKTREDDTLI